MLLMQQHMVQPGPDHQQGQRRRGQVHHQQGDVRQPGIIGEAQPDGQGQPTARASSGEVSQRPPAAEPWPRRCQSAAPT